MRMTHQDLLPPPPLTCFRESSKRLTMTSQRVSRQSSLAVDLIWGENRIRPAARSTASTADLRETTSAKHIHTVATIPPYSPGTLKAVNGVLSGMTALGRTNAPRATSLLEMGPLSGRVELNPEFPARAAITTLAKCVGTDTAGGLPITSYDCRRCETGSDEASHGG
jgi:hypothetical protein